MIGRFRRHDAFDLAAPEVGLPAGKATRDAVGHERRRGRTAGRDAHPAADARRAHERPRVARHLPDAGPDVAQADARMNPLEAKSLFYRHEDLADAEQPDDRDEEWNA